MFQIYVILNGIKTNNFFIGRYEKFQIYVILNGIKTKLILGSFERKIRRLKREREVYKEFDKDKYKEVNTSLQSTYKELDKFVDDNNLRRDYSREYININKNIGLANSKTNTLENHPLPKLLEKIDISNSKKIEETILKYENIIKNDIIEKAIVITKEGKVYQCFAMRPMYGLIMI